MKDDDVAIRFHRALASLPPSLSAAHVPKSSIAADPKVEPTIFGSVYSSNLCRARMRTIMETLGHSQISLTSVTYSHVIPRLQQDAAAKLDAILG